MNILIIGADGQLGSDLCKEIDKNEQTPLTIKDIDITDKNKTFSIIKKHQPNIVINTAAYNKVDDSEENDELAFRINALGTKYLALACRESGATLVHLSTDYVFDGHKREPYVETDLPNPRSAYGISKLAGEYYVKYLVDKHFIVRTASLFGSAGCLGKGGGNFVENIIKSSKTNTEIKVVGDEIMSPTYSVHLARKINELCRTEHYGLYHITNNGECSWYEFACKIFELLKIDAKVTKIKSTEYKTKAQRPMYSVLRNAKLQSLGLDDLPSWQEALKAYLIEKGYLSASQA
ncbi:MAG: dTDP-4-dehydrorhamnose reductase [bacterium]